MALKAKSSEFRSEAAAAETIRTGCTMSFEKAAAAEIRRLQPKCIFEMGSKLKEFIPPPFQNPAVLPQGYRNILGSFSRGLMPSEKVGGFI